MSRYVAILYYKITHKLDFLNLYDFKARLCSNNTRLTVLKHALRASLREPHSIF